MSYEIVYNHFTVKVEENCFVPFVYWGSNNCYQMSDRGRQIRERHWSVAGFLLKGKLFFSSTEEIEQAFERFVEERDSSVEEKEYRDNFASHMGISYPRKGNVYDIESWKRVFVNSAKKAYTLQDLIEAGIELKFEKSRSISSKADLELALLTARLLGKKINGYDLALDGDINWFLRKNKEKRKRPERVVIDVSSYYVLADEAKRVLVRYTPRGYKYTWGTSWSSKHFPGEKEAARFAQKHSEHKWIPLLVEKPERLQVLKSEAHKYTTVEKKEIAVEV